jgi:hypothetical protein
MADRKLCLNGCFRVLPIAEFGRHPRAKDGLAARCKACEADRAMLAKHGMTKRDKGFLAADQGGCAICGSADPGPKGWVVDHDRRCCGGDKSCPSCRRGILCHSCNTALGYAKDDPEVLRRMADYIELGARMSSSSTELKLTCEANVTTRTDGQDVRTKMVVTDVDQLSVATTRAKGDSL